MTRNQDGCLHPLPPAWRQPRAGVISPELGVALMERNWKDVAGGAMLLLLGGYIAFSALGFGLGSAARMGAGYYPLMLGLTGILVGAGITIIGIREPGTAPRAAPRTFLFVIGGLCAFSLLVERAGLMPAIWALVVLSALADREITFGEIVAVAAFASGAAWLIFILFLRLPVSGIEGLL